MTRSRELIEAFARVPPELGAKLVLLGEFSDDGLEAEVRTVVDSARTRCLGWESREQVLSRARIGVVLFGSDPNHHAVRSNKLFEYMGAGLP
jgi:hypothetical protein